MAEASAVAPAVMRDFVFGKLESDENTLQRERQQWSGIRHSYAIDPLDPLPGQAVTLTVTVGRDVLVDRVAAYVTTNGSEPMGSRGQAENGVVYLLHRVETCFQPLYWDYAEVWQGEIPGQPEGTHVRYRIEGWLNAGAGPSHWSNEQRIDGTSEPVTLYGYVVDRYAPPAWTHEAILYQVLVDRFAPVPAGWLEPEEMEGFVGGNLRGVIEALDYVADLGVTGIYLTPVFRIGSYHGYDTVDYLEIDPRFGTRADLVELVEGAHARGLRVILDFVANHSSDRFPPFREALANPDSPYRQWYSFDPSYQHGYRCFFTAANMPQFNHDDPAARGFLLDAARYWLTEFGVDGYRLDYAAGPSHDFWSAFGQACKEANPECWIFGEITLGSNWLRTYAGRLDGCLDFGFTRQIRLLCGQGGALVPISRFAAMVERTQRFFPPGFTRPAFIDNHDMNRFLWAASGSKQLLRMASALLLAFGGSPIIYYGTEVGLGQPRAKGHYREEARHPMLWGDDQDQKLLGWFREAIAMRRNHGALAYGPVVTLALDDERGLWLAERSHGDDRVLIAVNSSTEAQDAGLPDGEWLEMDRRVVRAGVSVPPRSVMLLSRAPSLP